jgi:hypothetical protein
LTKAERETEALQRRKEEVERKQKELKELEKQRSRFLIEARKCKDFLDINFKFIFKLIVIVEEIVIIEETEIVEEVVHVRELVAKKEKKEEMKELLKRIGNGCKMLLRRVIWVFFSFRFFWLGGTFELV